MGSQKQKIISNGVEKYIFILGQSPDIAQAELGAILNKPFEAESSDFVLVNTSINPKRLINTIGGTIKIARYIKTINQLSELNAYDWCDWLSPQLNKKTKNNFAFSLYNDSNKNYQIAKKISFELKKILKENNYKSRLVTGQSPVLSSVIVAKNKLINRELIIVKWQNKYILGFTEAVQDFESYGLRDIKRPNRDDKSGLLPPKLAQMMINLSGLDNNHSLLDPFCGSGTLLQEAMLLGYKKIYGSDISTRAIEQSTDNLNWLKEKFKLTADIKIQKSDVKNIDNIFDRQSVDLIVTEPFMGDARFINSRRDIKNISEIKNQLQELYRSSFEKFKKILSPQGKVVFIFPIFSIAGQNLPTLDKKIISQLGWQYLLDKDLIYSRPDQKVKRQITVWQIP